MPRKRFTNEQIALALQQAENGATLDEVYRTMACLNRRSTAGRSSSSAWVFKRQDTAASDAANVVTGQKVYLSPGLIAPC